MKTSHFIIVWMLLIVSVYGEGDYFSQYIKLYKTLEESMYGKIRPVTNQSKSLAVSVNIFLLGIQGLNEKDQLLESSIALGCRWKYETLEWNSSEYGGIRQLNFSPENAWIPDLTISNSVDSMFVLTDNSGKMNRITVMSNGVAKWYSGGNIRTSCRVDITKYPFDSQSCSIIIGKLEYDSEVYLTLSNMEVTMSSYKESGEWSLKTAIVEEILVHDGVTQIDVQLILSRYWFFYLLNVLLPVALLSVMMVSSFKIPPVSGERLGYNMALLLTFVVLLNLIGDSMPRVSKQVSYLQLYVSFQLTMAVVITALSIMQVKLEFTRKEINFHIIVKLYSLICRCRKLKKVEKDQSSPVEKEEQNVPEGDELMLEYRDIIQQSIEGFLTWTFFITFMISTLLFFIAVAF